MKVAILRLLLVTILTINSCSSTLTKQTLETSQNATRHHQQLTLKQIQLEATTLAEGGTFFTQEPSLSEVQSIVEFGMTRFKAELKKLLRSLETGDYRAISFENLEMIALCEDTFTKVLPVEKYNSGLHHRGRIFLNLPCEGWINPEVLLSTVRHELTHYYFNLQAWKPTLWIEEGVATMLQEDSLHPTFALAAQKELVDPTATEKYFSLHQRSNGDSPRTWYGLAACSVYAAVEEGNLSLEVLEGHKTLEPSCKPEALSALQGNA